MRYVRSRFDKEQEELSYRIYVTRVLRSLARIGDDKDWYRLIRQPAQPTDNRSGDEIAEDILRRLRTE